MDVLTAKRFVDIAVPLEHRAIVVTDNDGDVAKAEARYAAYTGHPFIRIASAKVGKDPGVQLLDANGAPSLQGGWQVLRNGRSAPRLHGGQQYRVRPENLRVFCDGTVPECISDAVTL